MFPTDVVIIAGARTPMARYTGSFSDVSAIDLAAHASKEAIRRSGADPAEIDHAIFGNVMQTSADALYGARHVGLKAGLKMETPAVTVNRLCGSGIEAIAQAAQRLLLGEAKMVLAGGMENMTQAPFVIRGARGGLKLGGRRAGRFPHGWPHRFLLRPADGAHRRKISRAAWNHAQRGGRLRSAQPASCRCRVQSVPHSRRTRSRRSEAGQKTIVVSEDDHRRPETTMEILENWRRRSKKMAS